MLAIGTEPSGLRCSYRWGINNGDGLDNFLLVRFRAGSVEITDDGRHTGLVAHGSGEVDGLLGVILGETRQQSIVRSCYFFFLFLFSFQRAPGGTRWESDFRLDLSTVTGSTLSRQESQRTVARGLKLTVRHLRLIPCG